MYDRLFPSGRQEVLAPDFLPALVFSFTGSTSHWLHRSQQEHRRRCCCFCQRQRRLGWPLPVISQGSSRAEAHATANRWCQAPQSAAPAARRRCCQRRYLKRVWRGRVAVSLRQQPPSRPPPPQGRRQLLLLLLLQLRRGDPPGAAVCENRKQLSLSTFKSPLPLCFCINRPNIDLRPEPV